MPVSERTYECLALEDVDRLWELHDGELREKPRMSFQHGGLMTYLGHLLLLQLNPAEFHVHVNNARVRRSAGNVYIPDVVVFPVEMALPFWDRADQLEIYADALPFVAEVWSPSTGEYDVNEKIAEYQQRGDREIWRLHPFERTVTVWRRHPDGSYAESVHRQGTVEIVALPGVAIDLDALFGYLARPTSRDRTDSE